MKTLRPIQATRASEKIIQERIVQFWDEAFFDYLLALIDENVTLDNSTDILPALFKSGKLVYSQGWVYGKINNRVALQLEKMGGKYHSRQKAYKLNINDMPIELQQIVSRISIYRKDNIKAALKYLSDFENQQQFLFEKLDFKPEWDKVYSDVEGQLKRSLKPLNIIPYDMNDAQRNFMAEQYTNNLKYYIQKWTEKEIVKLRTGLQDLITEGGTQKSLSEYIMAQKTVSKRKAKFLARNELGIFVAKYQQSRMEQNGISRYKWSTILDGRERPLHRSYNGKIFSWSEPPIIDELTGERGNPRETYNCRCKAVPVIDDDFWRG